MKKNGKKIGREIKVGIGLIVLSIVLFCLSPSRVLDAFSQNIGLIVRILMLTLVAVIISILISFLFPEDFAEKHLKGGKLKYLFIASILGILTPGPVYAMYPIVCALKKKGVENALLVSYITGQTLIGPARIPLEVGLLGLKFFLFRLCLALVMGPLSGALYIFLARIIPDAEKTGSPAPS